MSSWLSLSLIEDVYGLTVLLTGKILLFLDSLEIARSRMSLCFLGLAESS